ncbi:MAG: hypothetical protein AB7N24_21960 [Dehalococcoidia bacterium]
MPVVKICATGYLAYWFSTIAERQMTWGVRGVFNGIRRARGLCRSWRSAMRVAEELYLAFERWLHAQVQNPHSARRLSADELARRVPQLPALLWRGQPLGNQPALPRVDTSHLTSEQVDTLVRGMVARAAAEITLLGGRQVVGTTWITGAPAVVALAQPFRSVVVVVTARFLRHGNAVGVACTGQYMEWWPWGRTSNGLFYRGDRWRYRWTREPDYGLQGLLRAGFLSLLVWFVVEAVRQQYPQTPEWKTLAEWIWLGSAALAVLSGLFSWHSRKGAIHAMQYRDPAAGDSTDLVELDRFRAQHGKEVWLSDESVDVLRIYYQSAVAAVARVLT